MNDGNVAAGVRMTVDGAPLRPNETFRFDGSAEVDGSFRIFGGRGVDEITGSQGNDIISGGYGSDTLRGSGGNDVYLYRNVAESTSAGQDGIQDFNAGDLIDLSQIDADSNVGGNQAFHWIGSTAFTGSAGELRATASGPIWTVEGDVDGDGVRDIQFAVVVIDNSTHPLSGADFLL
jgi:Ca2+-binding RTX toxin-like protein